MAWRNLICAAVSFVAAWTWADNVASEPSSEVVGGLRWYYFLRNGEATIGTDWPLAAVASPDGTGDVWAEPNEPNVSGAIEVPSRLGGCVVTRIGRWAFWNCRDVTAICIPDTVRSIDSGAFGHCGRLTELTIPASVTNIAVNAFELSYSCLDPATGEEVWVERGCLTNLTFLGDAPRLDGDGSAEGDFTRYMASDACVHVKRSSEGWGVDIPGVWQGARIEYIDDSLVSTDDGASCAGGMPIGVRTAAWGGENTDELFPDLGRNPSAAVLNAVLDSAKMDDAAAVKAEIGGDAAKYAEFRAWTHGVDGGEAAVAASANAAISYMLGAERLFANVPTVEIGAIEVADVTAGTDGASGTEASRMVAVSVVVKDDGMAVKCDAGKVAGMFVATSDLGDWDGAAKLYPKVEVAAGTGNADDLEMRFTVALDTIPAQAFLRIRK